MNLFHSVSGPGENACCLGFEKGILVFRIEIQYVLDTYRMQAFSLFDDKAFFILLGLLDRLHQLLDGFYIQGLFRLIDGKMDFDKLVHRLSHIVKLQGLQQIIDAVYLKGFDRIFVKGSGENDGKVYAGLFKNQETESIRQLDIKKTPNQASDFP